MSLATFAIAQCRQYLPDKIDVEELLTMFVNNFNPEYQMINNAFETKDFNKLAFLLERLWEGSLYCGTPKLTALLKDAYEISAQGDISANILKSIHTEMSQVTLEINQFLNNK